MDDSWMADETESNPLDASHICVDNADFTAEQSTPAVLIEPGSSLSAAPDAESIVVEVYGALHKTYLLGVEGVGQSFVCINIGTHCSIVMHMQPALRGVSVAIRRGEFIVG